MRKGEGNYLFPPPIYSKPPLNGVGGIYFFLLRRLVSSFTSANMSSNLDRPLDEIIKEARAQQRKTKKVPVGKKGATAALAAKAAALGKNKNKTKAKPIAVAARQSKLRCFFGTRSSELLPGSGLVLIA